MGKKKTRTAAKQLPPYPSLATLPARRRREVTIRNRLIQGGAHPTETELSEIETNWQAAQASTKQEREK